MRARCVLGALAVFAGGVYTGLACAAGAARSAGCPAASGTQDSTRKRAKSAAETLTDAVDEVVTNLENLHQRSTAPSGRKKPGGTL